MKLKDCIKGCKQDNEECKIFLIEKFSPKIKMYNRKFLEDDIKSYFFIKLLEVSEKINLNNFNRQNENEEEAALVNYFLKILHNCYVDIIKHNSNRKDKILFEDERLLNEFPSTNNEFDKSDLFLDIDHIIKSSLTELQKNILLDILKDKSQRTIAKENNMSEQAVSNIKRRIQSILKKEMR